MLFVKVASRVHSATGYRQSLLYTLLLHLHLHVCILYWQSINQSINHINVDIFVLCSDEQDRKSKGWSKVMTMTGALYR